jgi:choline dehydrogenase-like flavoprotein
MLQHYKAVEYDIDAAAGNIPASSAGAHGLDPTEQEIGRIGSIDPGDLTDFGDTRPGVTTPRMQPANIYATESLTNSAVGGPAWAFVADRNNWDPLSGSPGGYTAPQVHKCPLNYVGFDSNGTPQAGGHQTIAHTHLDKYDERRSTLIAHIDRVRQSTLTGQWVWNGGTTVAVSGGSGATVAEVKVGDHIRLDTQGVNFKIASVGGTDVTLEDTFSLASFQLDAIPGIGDLITLSDSGGVIATLTAITSAVAPAVDEFVVAGGYQAATVEGVAVDILAAALGGTFATYVTASLKGTVLKLQSVAPNEPGGIAANSPLTVATTGTDMTVLVGTFTGAKAIPTGTGQTTANANHTLKAQCVVDKVEFEQPILNDGALAANLQVTKVKFLQTEHGAQVEREVYATKVVMAAGPIGTPGVMLRSGVGALDRLTGANFRIPQVLDLPGVGADVLQHTISGFAAVGSPGDEPSVYHSLAFCGQFRSSYTGGGGTRDKFAVGTPAVLFDEDPEVQFFFSVGGWNNLGIARGNLFGWGLAAKQARTNYRQGFLGIGANFKPRSRGDGIRLLSTNPNDTYQIQQGVFADVDAKDAEACVEGVNDAAGKLNDAGVGGGLIANGYINYGGAPLTVETIHGGAGGAFHMVSTFKMGVVGGGSLEPALSDRPCLDGNAKLLGADGLWACDNSIMPTHVRANPHQPTMAHCDLIAKNLISEFRLYGV